VTPIRVAVLGYGYWGTNLARNLAETNGMELVAIADPDPVRLALAKRRYPTAICPLDAGTILHGDSVDAVCITTPLQTHADIAGAALAAGKHVLIAKPLAHTLKDAETLAAQAVAQGLVLLVDHTFIYSGAVRELRKWCDLADGLGDWLTFDSVRVNLGQFRPDADVLWDLAAHDVSILLHLGGTHRLPTHVQAVGADPTGSGRTSVAHLDVWLEDDVLAHIHVSWLSPVKVRRTLLGGDRRMAIYDDTEPSEKIRIYDSGAAPGLDGRTDYRTGGCLAPKLDAREALAVECEDFAACIETGRAPLAGGPEGVAVVRLLEAASESLAGDGARVRL
jgi:predicted dehydrogenase